MPPSFRTLAAAAAIALAFVGVVSADGSPPAAGVGEAVCACPAVGAAPRLRRAVPQSCRLCSGLVATNAGTGNLDVGAANGKKVVVTAPLVAEKTLHIKDGTASVDVLAELAQLRSSIGTLTARADAAEARADTAEARADTAEARADTAEARADTFSAGASVLHSDVAANTKGVADLGASIKNIDVSVTGLAPDVAANTKGVADLGIYIIKNIDVSVTGLASDIAANTKGVADLGASIKNVDNSVKGLASNVVTNTEGVADLYTATTAEPGIGSAIFPLNGEVTAIKRWVQTGFAEFKGKAVKLVRCYSMAQSGDGGTSQGFHTACDNKGPTVTVVKTTKGWIFGGAADKDWTSVTGYVASDSAFLFCVKCAGAKSGAAPSQLKLTGQYNQRALYHSSAYGPVFGGGNDLLIGTMPGGSSTVSSSGLGGSYTCPAGQFGSTPCYNYLAGSKQFTVADYEVFVIEAL